MAFVKHSPFFMSDVSSIPPIWTEQIDFLGQSLRIQEETHDSEPAQTESIFIKVPHLSPDELKVQLLENNTIVVSGIHRKPDHLERFERHFAVDYDIDASHIRANLHKGMLVLTIQKLPKVQTIEITSGPPLLTPDTISMLSEEEKVGDLQ